ncbi:MAG: hypothetical protein H6Q14_638 [Bacteroidetes bacterium]|nr:hypothetical protein [Bacteroidota bacterium]
MKDFLDKAPFVRLLLVLLSGILLQYYVGFTDFSTYLFALGVLFLGVSFFPSLKFRYSLRPLFGIGISLVVCGIGIVSTSQRQKQTAFLFPKQAEAYVGTVNEMPQAKPRSIACRMSLEDSEKHNVVCYFQIDSMSRSLRVGDRVLFYAEIKPFKNRGNPDDFDYVAYMHRMGFSGTTYVAASRWEKLAPSGFSLYSYSQQLRSRVLDFYRTLNLGHDNFAVFSALTLGYMDELDDSVQQAFRATGTSHILSVSGLHVAILYMVIASMLSFLPKSRRMVVLRQLLIILLLWAYAFLTGLPSSVVRATLMISVFCMAVAMRKKAFSYNTVCFAAFMMLLYNPFDFFNIGFQLSFVAVLSICFFLPPILKIIQPKNKVANFFWETSAVSLAVQLGTYPICLFYFGTFPTYFFLTNLVIVPLSTLVMYSSLGIYLAACLVWLLPAHSGAVFLVPVWTLDLFLTLLLRFVSFFESLPSALIQKISLNLPQMFLLMLLSVVVLLFFQKSRPKTLMFAFGTISLFLLIGLPVFAKEKDPSVYVFNRNDRLEIGRVGEPCFVSDTTRAMPFAFLDISGLKIAVVKSDCWQGLKAEKPFSVDYLILSGGDSISMYHMNKLFNMKLVILDGVLSARSARRLQRECKKLSISSYDVKEKGAFRIKNY